nr:immunoglobulin heavy chain junction region [Macaca mulatta]MOW86953.1 immunoglobulin heavy chain junction region [Macaca mulatta]MOW92724.1 immunoglobulin heavy chain junction region [Macaca mulatta]
CAREGGATATPFDSW